MYSTFVFCSQPTTRLLQKYCIFSVQYCNVNTLSKLSFICFQKNPIPTLYPLSSVSCNYQCQCCCVHNFKSTRKDMETHSKHSKLIGFKLGLYQKDQTTASCPLLYCTKKQYARRHPKLKRFFFLWFGTLFLTDILKAESI